MIGLYSPCLDGMNRWRSYQTKTGWWYTYPVKNMSSSVEIIIPNIWKNKINVPNHQSDMISTQKPLVARLTLGLISHAQNSLKGKVDGKRGSCLANQVLPIHQSHSDENQPSNGMSAHNSSSIFWWAQLMQAKLDTSGSKLLHRQLD